MAVRSADADDRERSVRKLGRPCLWWEPVGEEHALPRVLAQIMNMGTYDDIRRLEALYRPDELAQVMRHAEPGWFTPRSWSFWRGRLGLGRGDAFSDDPPRRSLPGDRPL